jgi:hypothetical protein
MPDNDYAVVIGISRYPKLKDLQGPVQDAEDFCTWLTETAQVSDAHIRDVLSDAPPKPGDRPILQEIDKAFEEVFQMAKENPARRLYFYFAGHGCSAEANHLALLMADASMESLNYALHAPSYHDGLARKGLFKEQFIFYDCCRNYDRRVWGRRSPWSDDDPAPGAGDVKQFILYGAAFTQYANERVIDYSERRGLFTKALLEGLRGSAAQPRNGNWTVTTDDLVSYIVKRLKELAKPFKLLQIPSRGPGTAEAVEIVQVAPKLIDVTVTGPPDGAEVIIRNAKLKEIMRDKVQNGKVRFGLTSGTYMFVMAGDEARFSPKDVEPERPLVVNL